MIHLFGIALVGQVAFLSTGTDVALYDTVPPGLFLGHHQVMDTYSGEHPIQKTGQATGWLIKELVAVRLDHLGQSMLTGHVQETLYDHLFGQTGTRHLAQFIATM
jgi:hypothetical protein